MLAFHNDAALQAGMLAEMRWHVEQDKLISGTYGTEFSNGDFKGCAVGCSLHSFNRLRGATIATDRHKAFEETIGFPESLARLEDAVFEGLHAAGEKDAATAWPMQFLSAPKLGADLSRVADRVKLRLLTDFGLRDNARDDGKVAIDAVCALLRRRIAGDEPRADEWSAAWSAARSADSARSAAWSAAESAADSARSAAWSAAESAAWSAAESAAWSAFWLKCRDVILEEMTAA
jgi:hypothetical protein